MGKAQISQASIGENGKVTGGQPGDQRGAGLINKTPHETNVRKWYGPWGEVIRCKNTSLGQLAASYMVKLINSNLVGYNQSKRDTLWLALDENNWSVDRYIASGKKTDTDCSAFVYAVYCCAIPELREWMNSMKISPTTTTSWLVYKKYDEYFERYIDSEMTKKDDNLIVGDILNNPGQHMVMVCSTDGTVMTTNIQPSSNGTITLSNEKRETKKISKDTNLSNKVQKWSNINKVGNKRGIVLGTHMKQK